MNYINKKIIAFFLVVLLGVFYINDILMYSYVIYFKFKYHDDEQYSLYIVPDDNKKTLNECSEFKLLKEEVVFNTLRFNLPELDVLKVREITENPVRNMSVIYKDGSVISVIESLIDKENIIPDEIILEDDERESLINKFKRYSKSEFLDYVLNSTPDDLSVFEDTMESLIKIVILYIKQGNLPEELKSISKVRLNSGVNGYILEGGSGNKYRQFIFLLDEASETIYQIRFHGFKKDTIGCVLKSVSVYSESMGPNLGLTHWSNILGP